MTVRRRDLAGAFVGAACLCAGMGAGRASLAVENEKSSSTPLVKATKEAVRYQDKPKDIQSCAICSLFIKPDECKVVEGKVSADGWCSVFDMID